MSSACGFLRKNNYYLPPPLLPETRGKFTSVDNLKNSYFADIGGIDDHHCLNFNFITCTCSCLPMINGFYIKKII
jgi:hypothetical protein